MKFDSYDSLPLEKILSFHNILILIKSVFNKDKNNYRYKIFLEKVCISYLKVTRKKKFLYKS